VQIAATKTKQKQGVNKYSNSSFCNSNNQINTYLIIYYLLVEVDWSHFFHSSACSFCQDNQRLGVRDSWPFKG